MGHDAWLVFLLLLVMGRWKHAARLPLGSQVASRSVFPTSALRPISLDKLLTFSGVQSLSFGSGSPVRRRIK